MKKSFLIIIFIIIINFVSAITLKEEIDISLKENINYKKAEINKKISKINRNNSFLGLIPNFNYEVNYDETNDAYNKSYQISQSIFYNGKEVFEFLSNYYSYKKANNNYKNAKKNVIIETIRKYLSILEKKENVDLWRLEKQQSEKNYKRAKKMYEYGKIAKLDLLENENYFEYSRYKYEEAVNNYDLAKIDFQNYLNQGFDNIEDYSFKDVTLKEFDYYLDFARENSLDFKNLEYSLESSKNYVRASRMSKLPEINFFVEKSYSGNSWEETNEDYYTYGIDIDLSGWLYSTFGGSYNYTDYSDSYSGPYDESKNYSANVDVLAGDHKTGSYLSSKIDYLNARDNLKNKELELQKLVKTAYYEFKNSKNFYEMKKINMKAKEEKRRKTSKEYELGVIDASEKIEADKEYAQAKIDLLTAKYNYYISWFNLLKIVGRDFKI